MEPFDVEKMKGASDPAEGNESVGGKRPPMSDEDIARLDKFLEGVRLYKAKDYEKALEILEDVAEQGLAEAQFNCGNMYNRGTGTEVDQAKALYWFEKAAEQGFDKAQFICGCRYDDGGRCE